jgi:hypothetical protein
MTLDDKIARAKELIARREEIDTELSQLMNGTFAKRVQRCSKCGEEGHSARTCNQSNGARLELPPG